jgi:endonuclease YncB( thermonuclease family)
MRIVVVIFLCLIAGPLGAGEIEGVPHIVDADTVYIVGKKVRLSGVDAPETDQVCLDAGGGYFPCGVNAKTRLQEHFAKHPWKCEISGTDRYGRNLGSCTVNGEDVSRWLVRSGWALAFRRYSTAYVEDEDWAHREKIGLWSGAFVAPWDWRHRGPKTTILGAINVPIDAQRKLMASATAAEPPTTGCLIKANLSRRECIYHTPGGRFYDRLRMDQTTTRRWFCTEAEAEAAGCRKSKL